MDSGEETATTPTRSSRSHLSDSSYTNMSGHLATLSGIDASQGITRDDEPSVDPQPNNKPLSIVSDSQQIPMLLRRMLTISERFEETGDIPPHKRSKLEHLVEEFSAVMEDDASGMEEVGEDEERSGIKPDSRKGSEEFIEEADLYQVHDSLAAMLKSMRLRQQEQQHLHQLTVHKIEAIAERCLFQEQQIQDLLVSVKNLRVENQALGQENDRLRDTVAEAESESVKREVAVSAMTSAVAGLEGWIENVDGAAHRRDEVEQVAPRGRARRAVVRGKGRFRGRYYIDDDAERAGSDVILSHTQDLQDGVKAWIRGFRDVEDACNSPYADRAKEAYRGTNSVDEDEWGDFQTPSGNAR